MINNDIINDILDYINYESICSLYQNYNNYNINNVWTNITKYIILKYNDINVIYNKDYKYNNTYNTYIYTIFESIIFNKKYKYNINIYYLKNICNRVIIKIIQNENKYILFLRGKIKYKKININNFFSIKYIYDINNYINSKTIINFKKNLKNIYYIRNNENYNYNYENYNFMYDKIENNYLINKLFIIKHYLNKIYIKFSIDYDNFNKFNIKYI